VNFTAGNTVAGNQSERYVLQYLVTDNNGGTSRRSKTVFSNRRFRTLPRPSRPGFWVALVGGKAASPAHRPEATRRRFIAIPVTLSLMRHEERLRAITRRFAGVRVIIAGDLILDRYWWGSASRLSPEAPVPVVKRERTSVRPGGAANTAVNMVSLGATAELFGVAGQDRNAEELRVTLSAAGIADAWVHSDPGRPTTAKTRVMALNQQVVRVDDESCAPISAETAREAAARIRERLPGASALLFSDYAKGFLTPELLQDAIAAAREAGIPVFIDPKGRDAARYAGCTLLKPNRLELGLLAGMEVHSRQETITAGRRLSAGMAGTKILVTEGAAGMTLFECGEVCEQAAAPPRQVYDVTGAGDTVLAAMALAIAAGAEYRDAMHLAIAAASLAIGVMGTAAVTAAQLDEYLSV
jgi:D-beta-D-heptose 7-phosphate kinase/D-beta-D-heptose 1-phosphate adenosyltransferase